MDNKTEAFMSLINVSVRGLVYGFGSAMSLDLMKYLFGFTEEEEESLEEKAVVAGLKSGAAFVTLAISGNNGVLPALITGLFIEAINTAVIGDDYDKKTDALSYIPSTRGKANQIFSLLGAQGAAASSMLDGSILAYQLLEKFTTEGINHRRRLR